MIALIIFIIPMNLSQWLFALYEKKRMHFIVRLIISEMIFLFAAGVLLTVFSGIHGKLISLLLYFGIFILSCLQIYSCIDVPMIELMYISTCGYALEHAIYSLYSICTYYFGVINDAMIVHYFVFYTISLLLWVLLYFVLIRRNRYGTERKRYDITVIALSMIILLVTLVMSVLVDMKAASLLSASYIPVLYVLRIYALISCILIIWLEYALSRINFMRHENEFMERLIRTQGNQMHDSKESMSIINRKIHDMKYAMHALQKKDDIVKSEHMQDLTRAIHVFDSIYHTGIEALDILLQEKSLIFQENHVMFSCIADGKLLSFLTTEDLYVLMGNALDNAFESVMKTEEDKRIISLNIAKKHGMTRIHLENYCDADLLFQDGIPQTTKEDSDYHGFGTQSIQYITKKYDGMCAMKLENKMFCLDIFFSR